MTMDVTKTDAWQALGAHADNVRAVKLRDLFAGDLQRGARLTAQAGDLYVDYSKNRVTDDTLALLRRSPSRSV